MAQAPATENNHSHSRPCKAALRLMGARVLALGLTLGLTLALTLGLLACTNDTNKNTPTAPTSGALASPPTTPPTTAPTKPIKQELWNALFKTLGIAAQTASTLNTQVHTFLEQPNAQHLQKAQASWLSLRNTYEATYFYKHFQLAQPTALEPVNTLHKRIGAWPVQPGMLDRFGPYPFSGLVFDISVPLTEGSLRDMHQATGDDEVITGLYSLEFLLFGHEKPRAISDYTVQTQLTEKNKTDGYQKTSELPNHRRRQLLEMLSELLLKDVQSLQQQWQSTPIQDALNSLGEQDAINTSVTFFAEQLVTLGEQTNATALQQGYMFQRMEKQVEGWLQILPELQVKDEAAIATQSSAAIATLKQLIKDSGELTAASPAGSDAAESASNNAEVEAATTNLENKKSLYQQLSKIAQLLQNN